MITGSITPDGREAVITLDLFGGNGRRRQIEAMIDTGFTDRLTLPSEVTELLNLPVKGAADVVLADGSVQTLPIYRVELIWHGQRHWIRAYAAPGGALVGMALLYDSRLSMEVEPGGSVTIEELS